jgi:hypothetical protein
MRPIKGVNNENELNELPQPLVRNDKDSDMSTYEMGPGEETLDSDWDDMDSIPPSTYAWNGENRVVSAPESAPALNLEQLVDQNHSDAESDSSWLPSSHSESEEETTPETDPESDSWPEPQ